MSESVAFSESGPTLGGYDLLRDTCGRLELNGFSVVELRGEDRKGWLQGQVTHDLRRFDPQTSSAFCLCSATGQIQAVCDAWALDDRFLLTMETRAVPAFLQRVESMVVMEDVSAIDLTSDHRLISFQGPRATAVLSERLALPALDAQLATFEGAEVVIMRSNRTGLGGWDVLVPAEAEGSIQALRKISEEVTHDAYEVARLEAGIPRLGIDIGDKTMPPEMGQSFVSRHVSYSKGCYVGQEVLMRIHSRGHTNWTWMGLMSDDPIPADGRVVGGRERDLGRVTSVAWSPDYGSIGAAMLRNEVAQRGEWVRIEGGSGTVEAEVHEMPLLRFE